MSAPAQFIALEGIDGCGKSTQVEMLTSWLTGRGVSVCATRQPGGTAFGAHLREMLLHGDDLDPRAEALLFAADRAQHVTEVIAPALKAGQIVVCDRYVASSLAYQGLGRGLNIVDVARLSAFATGGLMPGLTIVLDLDPETSRQRRSMRSDSDRIEAQLGDRLSEMRDLYLSRAHAEPATHVVVDASGTPDHVARAVRSVVYRHLGKRRLGRPVDENLSDS